MNDENLRRVVVESPVHGLAIANELRRLHEKHDKELYDATMRAVFPNGTLERLAALEENHAGLTLYYEAKTAALDEAVRALEYMTRESPPPIHTNSVGRKALATIRVLCPDEAPRPLPLVLYCPAGHQHVDEGEWAARPHKTHQCQAIVCSCGEVDCHDHAQKTCGREWRPANFPTVGVKIQEAA